jgi:tRNA-Thr(GGU) m(6)t(6)A37 methyltransferase TsaA
MPDAEQPSLSLRPIGFVRTASRSKFDAPSQPDAEAEEVNHIDLLPSQQFELALKDLDGFDKIWLLWWFDRNKDWRPTVLPPRGPSKRRGVFSTRSPHRPNPIGLTCVSLLRVDGLTLTVGPLDLLDGTPIIDIKPYLRTVDCYPESSLGWLESVEAAEQLSPPYRIELAPRAELQLKWLKENWHIDFTERAFRILSRDPTPHRTRRVLKMPDGRFRIACGAWRLFYRIEESHVLIEEVGKGYSDENLQKPEYAEMIDRKAMLAFAAWSTR